MNKSIVANSNQKNLQVSVIIPIYNGETDLPALLKTLYNQTYPRDRVEYLLIDNGSTDQTWQQLQTAQTQAQQNNFPLRILQESTIQGSYAARNLGIRESHADLLAFTDADCRPEPTWLTNLAASFEDHPQNQILNSQFSILNSKLGWVAGEVKALPSKNWLERYADRADTLSQNHTLANPYCPYGQTANIAIRKQCFVEVGLFRPYLTTGGDADQCWRILKNTSDSKGENHGSNWQWAFAEDAIVYHRHRSTLSELLSQWRRYGRSNRYLHHLHNIELMPMPQLSYYTYRLSRWLLKEMPIALLNRNLLEMLSTPVGLLCLRSRWRGQQRANLPSNAHEIPQLTRCETPIESL
jgi:glycosyltransferase involved in cell wall biosynthesis